MRISFDSRRVDAVFAELDQCHLPGAAVGVAVDGEPAYRRGFGLANMELPITLTPSMRMRLASASKHYACLAYLLLCEEGRAGLDDRVRKYLPEMHPVSDFVTMRQLMNHTGGLRDAHDIRHVLSGTLGATRVADVVELYRDLDTVNFEPGLRWSYNNGGYLLLCTAIERISGRSLEEQLRERIFAPADMHDTMLRRWDADFIPNSATLHMAKVGGGFEKTHIGKEHVGEGGVISTVDDMLRWLAHMDAPRIGNEATWREMKTPARLTNGTSTNYGLGLYCGRYRGVDTISHAGGTMGGNAEMLKIPAAGLDIIVLVNRHDVSASGLAEKVIDECVQGLAPRDEFREDAVVSGDFHSPETGRVVQLFGQGGQQIAAINGTNLPFVSCQDGRLRPVPMMRYFKIAIGLVGERTSPAALEFDDFGNRERLERVPPPDNASGNAISGAYRSRATGTRIEIRSDAQSPRMSSHGRFGTADFRLHCISDQLWLANSTDAMAWSGVLSFKPRRQAFDFSTMRNVALPFERCT